MEKLQATPIPAAASGLLSSEAAAITDAVATAKTRTKTAAGPRTRGPDTRDKLIVAAAKEFKQHGFDRTDSNKIARRAGYAPQTFYRWFRDKTEIFITVYRQWEDKEREVIGKVLTEGSGPRRLFEAAVAHHRAYRQFRRSLRQLSLDNPVVRRARAESRLRQVERIKRWIGPQARPTAEIAAILLQIERLCDALAEGEFADMGLGEEAGYAELIELKAQLSRQV
jgi:AcrR family transcriptional regulator